MISKLSGTFSLYIWREKETPHRAPECHCTSQINNYIHHKSTRIKQHSPLSLSLYLPQPTYLTTHRLMDKFYTKVNRATTLFKGMLDMLEKKKKNTLKVVLSQSITP